MPQSSRKNSTTTWNLAVQGRMIHPRTGKALSPTQTRSLVQNWKTGDLPAGVDAHQLGQAFSHYRRCRRTSAAVMTISMEAAGNFVETGKSKAKTGAHSPRCVTYVRNIYDLNKCWLCKGEQEFNCEGEVQCNRCGKWLEIVIDHDKAELHQGPRFKTFRTEVNAQGYGVCGNPQCFCYRQNRVELLGLPGNTVTCGYCDQGQELVLKPLREVKANYQGHAKCPECERQVYYAAQDTSSGGQALCGNCNTPFKANWP